MNIFLRLITNQWKESIRSILWQRNLATNIFFSFIFIVLILNFLSVGLLIDSILKNKFPGQDYINIFNSWLIFYFLVDIILRYFLQKNPGIIVKPYLHLPVPRAYLIHLLLLKTAGSIFNILPLFILIPFCLKLIVPQYGITAAVIWLAVVVLIIFCNGFFALYLTKRSFIKSRYIVITFLCIVILAVLNQSGYIELAYYSALFFGMILAEPGTATILLPILFVIFTMIYRFFKRQLYQDQSGIPLIKNKSFQGTFSYLESLGELGEYIALEVKMLFRNKRTRSSMSMVLMMFLVGPFFYFSISREFNTYPEPGIYQENLIPGESVVTFRVLPDTVPKNASIFITGKQQALADWKPDRVALDAQPDGSWQRRISFPPGTLLKYKFTLGTWKAERLNADGSTPKHYTVLVQSDTTLTHHAAGWREPQHLVFIDIMLVYMGLTLISILMLVYGQFILAWESSYFDIILVRPINYVKYFQAKYILLLIFGALVYLICTPLVFLSSQILYINTVLFVYSIGINSIIMMLIATYARKRLDLQASIFSTQGKGVSQFTLIVPTLIVPVILFLPFAISGHIQMGYLFLLFLGSVGVIFHRQLNKLVIYMFFRQKHNLSSGFRHN